MTNRVVMGALPGGGHGLRVSRPGFDVMSTSLQGKQIAFDSRWPRACRIYRRGTISLSPQSGAPMHWIGFGETLPYVPTVFVLLRRGSNAFWEDISGRGGKVWTNDYFSDGQYQVMVEDGRLGLRRSNGDTWHYSYIVLKR